MEIPAHEEYVWGYFLYSFNPTKNLIKTYLLGFKLASNELK